jgi:hypothetical protein
VRRGWLLTHLEISVISLPSADTDDSVWCSAC